MKARNAVEEKEAVKWIGHLVCAVLHDGSYYVGRVQGVENGELIMAGVRGDGVIAGEPTESDKVMVSGFLGSLLGGLGGMGGMGSGLGGMFGNMGGMGGAGGAGMGGAGGAGAAGAGNAGAGGGLFGNIGRMMPAFRIGFGMLRFMWPMIGKFI